MGTVRCAEAVFSAVRLDDFVAAPLKQDGDQLNGYFFVVNYQNLFGHLLPSLLRVSCPNNCDLSAMYHA
jgi:hypothetical protein